MGDKFIPGVLDHYLAWVGYGAQQTDEPAHRDRPDNLFNPVPGDYGAHGRFDNQARDTSLQLWLNMYRGWFALLGAGVVAAFVWRNARARIPRR
jgi:hypothetical protein